MNRPAPLVLVVGFLGAGKTTFLRGLLPLLEARGLQPFVIINDYANARVDASSLAQEGRAVTPINGNCICCDSVIELMNVLLEIPPAGRRVVLIEANGTTDPTALIEHLLVNPELRRRFSPLLQVAIVDVKRWQKRHWHNELERLQVETASHILFTREDEVGEERFAAVRADIEWFNPKAAWIKRQPFALEIERLAEETPEQCFSPAPHPQASSHEEHDLQHSHPEHTHHDGHRHQLAHAFVGLEIDLPEPMEAEHLHRWLKSLPPEVLRVKGVVRLAEEPDRWFQFQRIDEYRGEARLYELPQRPVVPACAVLIGVRLDEASLGRALLECATIGQHFTRLPGSDQGETVPV